MLSKEDEGLLKKALNVFDPARPLEGELLDSFYISRPHAPLKAMKAYLRANQSPVKVLFCGHRGCGKSTELARLAKDLENEFLIVPVSARSLDLADLTYVDVILASAAGLFLQASSVKGAARIKSSVLKDVLEWLGSEIVRETTVSVLKSGNMGAKLSVLILSLQGKYSSETTTRKTVRDRLYRQVSDLIQRMDAVCEELEKKGVPPLILFEDIDKADLERARGLFVEHRNTMISPACRIIYTFPISLRHSHEFPAIRRDYSKVFSLPNISINERNGSIDARGREAIGSVITRRIPGEVFEKKAFDSIVELSGGLMTDLVRLVSDAALIALTEGSSHITNEIVERVEAEMANDYRRILVSEHYDALRRSLSEKEFVADDVTRELLANQSLLEYRNNKVWCDVHPIVRGLL